MAQRVIGLRLFLDLVIIKPISISLKNSSSRNYCCNNSLEIVKNPANNVMPVSFSLFDSRGCLKRTPKVRNRLTRIRLIYPFESLVTKRRESGDVKEVNGKAPKVEGRFIPS